MAAPKGRLGVRYSVPGAPNAPRSVRDWPEHGREWIPGEIVPLEETGLGEAEVRAWIDAHTPKPTVTTSGKSAGREWPADDVCAIELVEVAEKAKAAAAAGEEA